MKKLINLLLLIVNILALTTVLPIIEYDLSKSFMPSTGWLKSYPAIDLMLLSIVSIVAIYNISLLFLAMLGRLIIPERVLWINTITAWTLVGIVALILGDSFLPILFLTNI